MSTKLTLAEATKNFKTSSISWQQAKERARIWICRMSGQNGVPAKKVSSAKPPKRLMDAYERSLRSNPWWKIRMESIYFERNKPKAQAPDAP